MARGTAISLSGFHFRQILRGNNKCVNSLTESTDGVNHPALCSLRKILPLRWRGGEIELPKVGGRPRDVGNSPKGDCIGPAGTVNEVEGEEDVTQPPSKLQCLPQ